MSDLADRSTTTASSDDFATQKTIDISEPTIPGLRSTTLAPIEPGIASDADEWTARYRRGPLLGEGGMGEVRLLRDQWVGRDIAIKRLRERALTSSSTRARFLREARVQGQLEHPAIVPVYDLGAGGDGELYFTMRRVRGHTLAEVLGRLRAGETDACEQYSQRKLLSAFVNVCLAVHYAHTRGVVHRDLKPDNIMLGDFGEVYVLDWGVARVEGAGDIEGASDADAGASLTQAGAVVGTPAYMSPEQARGEANMVTPRSDVYSLGLILYEILTFERAHAGKTPVEVFSAMLAVENSRPSIRRADVAPELDDLCVRATNPVDGERIATARELADGVERYLDGDRDLERRRTAAAVNAERAAKLADRALGRSISAEDAQTVRGEAMDSVMHALALDPANESAKSSLVRLMVEQGEHMPPEAARAMRESEERKNSQAVRGGRWMFYSFLPCFGAVWWMGIRDWRPIAMTALFWTIATAITVNAARRTTVGSGQLFAVAVFTSAMFDMVGCWMGPFVLVPVALTTASMAFASFLKPSLIVPVTVLSTFAALAPYVAELLHVFSPAWSFVNGDLVLHARGVYLSESRTIPALMYTAFTFAVFPAVYSSRMRAMLSTAERKLFVQAWYLERLKRGGAAAH